VEKLLLKWIIEKYEGSKKFKESVLEGNMSVNLISKKEYYDDKNYKQRFSINDYAKQLENQGLVKIIWHSKDNIIDKVQISLTNIDTIYNIGNIPRVNELLNNVIREIDNYIDKLTVPWISTYMIFLKSRIEKDRRLPSIISDGRKRWILFNTIKGVDELTNDSQSMLARVFSKKYLMNSKVFENEVQSTLVGLVKKFKPDIELELSDDEILEEIGIEKTNNELSLKGPMKLALGTKIIDLSNFIYGVGLNSPTLKNATILEVKIDRIISVENKANFLYECESAGQNDLILFSSGFYNPYQRKFLRILDEFICKKRETIAYYHCGDYDYGGINIYKHIKNEIFTKLQPYKMNVKMYVENLSFAEPILDKAYVEKLRKLLSDENISELHEVIEKIISEEKVLEQESLLF